MGEVSSGGASPLLVEVEAGATMGACKAIVEEVATIAVWESVDERSANALVQLEAHLTIARRALQKSACQLQRSLGSVVAEVGTGWCAGTAEECARTNQ